MAALDHIDGVDLHIAQMGNGGARRLGSVAERGDAIELLRRDPQVAGAGLADDERRFGQDNFQFWLSQA